jgi:hypothetical protein
MNYLETLVSSSKIVDECEKKLESNVITKKNILDIIMKQLNLIKIDTRMSTLKREDAIIREANKLYANLN